MDLVDIDKVLDNLELNEEEHRKEKIPPIIKQRQPLTPDIAVVSSSQSQISSSTLQNESEQNTNYVSSATINNATTADRVNRFVGVSQVFNSLDEYRKNVESLDLYTNNKTDDNTSYNNLQHDDHTLLIRSDGNADDNDDDEDVQNVRQNVRQNDDGEDDDEDDGYAGDEINKFVGADDFAFSSNSITTSSSSTFSSGPSPALDSDSELLYAKEELEALKLAMKEFKETSELNKHYYSNTSDGIDSIQQNENGCTSNSDNNRLRQQQHQRFDFDDLAVGLSSISLTPHQDSNLSLSESPLASVGSSKFILKTDNLSSPASSSPSLSPLPLSQNKKNYRNSDEKQEEYIEQKINGGTASSSGPPNLGNSGSANEEEVSSSKFILKTDNLSSSPSSSASLSPLPLSQNKKKYRNSYKKQEKYVEQKINGGTASSSGPPNLGNSGSADEEEGIVPATQPNVMVTFSSTMDEISDTELDSILQEIYTESHPHQMLSPEKDRSSIAAISGSGSVGGCEVVNKIEKVNQSNSSEIKLNTSSISSNSNVSLVGQKRSGDVDGMMNIDSFSLASTLEFTEDRPDDAENDVEKQGVSNFDENEICDDADNGEKKDFQKRQRPTTLDFKAKKINLYATAGQTPPGSRIFDQATSSSDEDTPEDKLCAMKSDENFTFNDGAGHTPPERSDRTVYFGGGAVGGSTSLSDLETLNEDEPMLSAEVEIKVAPSACESLPAAPAPEQLTLAPTISTDLPPPTPLYNNNNNNIGKVPPIWVPDQEANACMQCHHKFTMLKRRHHCRACGQVLCSVCCSQKFKLEFLSNLESRVCVQCFLILTKMTEQNQQMEDQPMNYSASTSIQQQIPPTTSSPNPNNPMEYCSKIPPYRQVNPQAMTPCPTVIVPVGVLKKQGNPTKSRKRKSVMFSDGIRPGSDLASLDGKWSDAKHARKSNLTADNLNECTPSNAENNKMTTRSSCKSIVLMDDGNGCYIPPTGENTLPPIVISKKSEKLYQEVTNNGDLIKRLQTESLKFVIQNNFFVFVKISHLKCCINKTVINFTTCGLNTVGNDEIIILLELDNSNKIPKDIFVHLNEIYWEASRGHPITELGFSMPKHLHFLGSREHGGFLFIRSTFQCLLDVNVPSSPFLIGVLIHRWEVPWAKIFPLRLMLRLGAHYRYYPSPHISVREREPVYAEIAQTIINLLADFRNYTYTIPTIKGMYIHMEDRRTNILIPRNRLDEVIKAINNSSDHILAMGANFSKKADGHLVCIQNIKSQNDDSHAYSTQAINIQGQPRKVTGASFFVFNEALKTTSGLSGKCSIIEDGLMVQILPSKMAEIRNSLTNMKDVNIVCGPIDADEQQSEVVHIQWVNDDVEMNIGVRSPIDSKKMDGIPSIRVHSGITLSNNNYILKWTEVFIIEMSSDVGSCKTSVDVSKLSEQIARNASLALLPFLDLLVANGSVKIGLRVTLNNDNVCYEAGSQNEKLPPLYMNALDNELIQTLHKQANEIGKTIVLELIFHILNVHINM